MDKKNNVRIYDYIDDENPKLARMWSRRYGGYTGMGYKVAPREKPVIGKLPLE